MYCVYINKHIFKEVNNDRLIYLLTRKSSGNITMQEHHELFTLIKENEADAFIAEGMEELFNSSLHYDESISDSTSNALIALHKKIHLQESGLRVVSKRHRFKFWAVAAASVLLFISLGVMYVFKNEQHSASSKNIVTTKKGSKTNLVLPDGSKVWVNADTKLTYDKEFGNSTRDVFLTGEAFFDVVKDKKHPFIVHTATMDVRVLGTAFNVKAYDGETNAQATLIRGSVEVLLKNNSHKKIVLSPYEKIIVRSGIAKELQHERVQSLPELEVLKVNTTKKDSTATETQWVQNRLVFNQEKLENILPVLERWFNVSIETRKIKNTNRLYNGIYENDSLQDVLESLKMVGGFNYTIEKDKVIIF